MKYLQMTAIFLLTLSGSGFFSVPGPGGWGDDRKSPRPITLLIAINSIEMKFGRVIENHKSISLV